MSETDASDNGDASLAAEDVAAAAAVVATILAADQRWVFQT